MFVERIKTMRRKRIMVNEKQHKLYNNVKKTMVDMKEKNTYNYLTIAYITSKTVLLLVDIAIFNRTFGRIII